VPGRCSAARGLIDLEAHPLLNPGAGFPVISLPQRGERLRWVQDRQTPRRIGAQPPILLLADALQQDRDVLHYTTSSLRFWTLL
jgi:hypothetical protein